MFRVVYEVEDPWPSEGPLRVDVQISGEVAISPQEAKQRANAYLSMEVSTGLYADEPVLVWVAQPYWRLSLTLRLPGLDVVEVPGAVDVSATTGVVAKFSPERLHALEDAANAIAHRLTREATSAG